MAPYHKVVWREGMFLSPHHFQQWDCYHEGILDDRLKQMIPLGWGLTNLDVRVRGEKVVVNACSGILKEGLLINIPEDRPLEERIPTFEKALHVYLAIPKARPGEANYRPEYEDARKTRYIWKTMLCPDETMVEENRREIELARKNLQLLLLKDGDGEGLRDYEYLKIAELERRDGAIKLREDYIPPCLVISVSSSLVHDILSDLLDVLKQKSDDLSTQLPDFYLMSTIDVVILSFLQSINPFIFILEHFQHLKQKVHPEELFQVLVQLAGSVAVFARERELTGFPTYNHENLTDTFQELHTKIDELLKKVTLTSKYREIPLVESTVQVFGATQRIFKASLPDELLTSFYRFYLAVSAGVPEQQLIYQIPLITKIDSIEKIQRAIEGALQGIELNYPQAESLPPTIRKKPGYHYFYLDDQRTKWESLRTSKTIAIHLSSEFPNLKVEVVAVEK